MVEHVLHADAQRILKAHHDHAERIPDKEGIRRIVHETGDAVVIGRDHGQFVIAFGGAKGDGSLFHGVAPILGRRWRAGQSP